MFNYALHVRALCAEALSANNHHFGPVAAPLSREQVLARPTPED
jgi:hypothetical protein